MARVTTSASIPQRLYVSFLASAGTIVFGMMDGTVSIFGLILGVAATTTSTATVLIAGASGAAAAAVSMMAGAYLDVETSRDEMAANRAQLRSDAALGAAPVDVLLSNRLAAAGLTPAQSAVLVGAVRHNPEALKDLLFALQAGPEVSLNPWEQALWMLLTISCRQRCRSCPLSCFRSPRPGWFPLRLRLRYWSGSASDGRGSQGAA
jgi:vacuolar iron transporter family protein